MPPVQVSTPVSSAVQAFPPSVSQGAPLVAGLGKMGETLWGQLLPVPAGAWTLVLEAVAVVEVTAGGAAMVAGMSARRRRLSAEVIEVYIVRLVWLRKVI